MLTITVILNSNLSQNQYINTATNINNYTVIIIKNTLDIMAINTVKNIITINYFIHYNYN